MSMDRKMAREDAREDAQSKVEDGVGESAVARIDAIAVSSVDAGAIASE